MLSRQQFARCVSGVRVGAAQVLAAGVGFRRRGRGRHRRAAPGRSRGTRALHATHGPLPEKTDVRGLPGDAESGFPLAGRRDGRRGGRERGDGGSGRGRDSGWDRAGVTRLAVRGGAGGGRGGGGSAVAASLAAATRRLGGGGLFFFLHLFLAFLLAFLFLFLLVAVTARQIQDRGAEGAGTTATATFLLLAVRAAGRERVVGVVGVAAVASPLRALHRFAQRRPTVPGQAPPPALAGRRGEDVDLGEEKRGDEGWLGSRGPRHASLSLRRAAPLSIALSLSAPGRHPPAGPASSPRQR